MTPPVSDSDSLFRQAAEAEDGIPVSAGARVGHVRLAEENGKSILLSLADVPADRRVALIEELREMVRRAGPMKPTAATPSPSDPS